MSREKRRKKLVHRSIQLTLVKQVLLLWILFVTTTGFLSVVFQLMLDPFQSAADWNYHLRVIIGSLSLASFCLLPVFVMDSLKLSNRFVGPIVRLHSHIRLIRGGETKELMFRAGDFWKEIPGDFNQMIAELRDPRHDELVADRASAEDPEAELLDAELQSPASV